MTDLLQVKLSSSFQVFVPKTLFISKIITKEHTFKEC